MITSNPFAGLMPATVMQTYVIVMFFMVVGGTILDMMHKKSAKYFFENSKKARKQAKRDLNSGEKTALLVKTIANEVLTSSEFANPNRRLSHLFTMYGFIIFVVSTVVLVFAYPTKEIPAPTLLNALWHLGALSICIGGYWFWFFIRVDVSAEGNPWYLLTRGDLFIVSLLMMATFALLWSMIGSIYLFAAFIAASTTLFSTVLWSKFAHMFFKPAAAYQKRLIKADGSRENLPEEYDLNDPSVQKRFPDIPTYMGEKPAYMGLGIKREPPNHY